MAMAVNQAHVWRRWLDHALVDLENFQLGRQLLPIVYPAPHSSSTVRPSPGVRRNGHHSENEDEIETFDGLGPWDRETVEIEVSMPEFQAWLGEKQSTG